MARTGGDYSSQEALPVPARVVVFLDWQNVYNGAREMFCTQQAPHWRGQVDPVALARHLAGDSPFDRQLHQVRIYRGQPDGKLDPRGYSASRRQHATWQRSPLVTLVTRPLRYPQGWPTRSRVGERPQEKGIDVALAIDFVVMAVRKELDVGILMSTDTDMKPALEASRGSPLHKAHERKSEPGAFRVGIVEGCQSSRATSTAIGSARTYISR